MDAKTKGKSLDWEFEVDLDENDYFDGEDGDYDFEIVKVEKTIVEKGTYSGDKNIKLSLMMKSNDKKLGVKTENLILNEDYLWKIKSLIKCLDYSSGKSKVDFDSLIGKSGRCHIKTNEKGYSNVDKFYAKTNQEQVKPLW